MSEPKPSAESTEDSLNEFEKAGQESELSLVAEFFLFLKEEKKWWLTPIIIVFLIVGVTAFFSATGVAPFIYSLF